MKQTYSIYIVNVDEEEAFALIYDERGQVINKIDILGDCILGQGDKCNRQELLKEASRIGYHHCKIVAEQPLPPTRKLAQALAQKSVAINLKKGSQYYRDKVNKRWAKHRETQGGNRPGAQGTTI